MSGDGIQGIVPWLVGLIVAVALSPYARFAVLSVRAWRTGRPMPRMRRRTAPDSVPETPGDIADRLVSRIRGLEAELAERSAERDDLLRVNRELRAALRYAGGSGAAPEPAETGDHGLRHDLEVLGFAPDAVPDRAALRRAYRDGVKNAHPDQGGSDAALREVTEAYDRLAMHFGHDASAAS